MKRLLEPERERVDDTLAAAVAGAAAQAGRRTPLPAGEPPIAATTAPDDPGYARALRRTFEVSTVGLLLLVGLSAIVTAWLGSGRLPVDVVPMAAWGMLASGAGVLLGITLAGRHHAKPRLAALLLGVALVGDTGMLVAAGGMAGPFWVVFLPLVLVTAATVATMPAVIVGLLASLGVAVAGLLTHTAGTAVGRSLLVLPLFPLVGWVAATLAAGARDAARAADLHRAALERDVSELSRLLDAVADGDLTRVPALPAGGADATTGLAVAFADTLLALRRLVRQITSVGEQLAGSAAEVRRHAEEHGGVVEHQLSAVRETTSTIEQLAATAAQIADTAERVSRYAGTTLRSVEEGAEAVDASVEAMQVIALRVDAITERARGLRDRTGRIDTILLVLDDLARQTNLLAFNAAVEAARAGDHGRGFSLVAAEVRKLAERAREATAQVRGIVLDIAAQTESTLSVSEAGAAEVRGGTDLTSGVVGVLQRITMMATQTTAAAREITVATRQQRAASDAVVAAMAAVSETSTRFTSGSQRYVKAAEGMGTLADGLQQSIRRFEVG